MPVDGRGERGVGAPISRPASSPSHTAPSPHVSTQSQQTDFRGARQTQTTTASNRSASSATASKRPRRWLRLSPVIAASVLGLGVLAGLGYRSFSNQDDEAALDSARTTVPEAPSLREFDADNPAAAAVLTDPASPGRTLQRKSAQAVPAEDEEEQLQPSAEVPLVLSSVAEGSSSARHKKAGDALLIERAFNGEDDALLQIELKSERERTFEDAVALAEGREVQARRDARALARRFIRMDPTSPDDELMRQMLDRAGDPLTYRQAQLGLAKHDSKLGPELLLEVARRYRRDETISEFAQMLLSTKPVYERAGEAMQLAIDAWTTSDCQDARGVLHRAKWIADRRALVPLSKFASRIGCGEDLSEDCYPCLREDQLLSDALNAARSRAPRDELP